MALPRKPLAGAPRERTESAHALLPALAAVLAAIPDGAERRRFELFFAASTEAIDALSDLDFSRYEKEEIGTADLSVWEALAPVVRDTLVDVNKLLSVSRAQFPELAEAAPDDSDAAFDEMFGEPSAAPVVRKPAKRAAPVSPARAAVDAIQAIASSLAREVTAFGEGIRKPVVMADRWNLLAHLSEFRGKFRAGIGEMVFQAAGAFSDVKKEQVVPGYREDIDEAVRLRRLLAVLSSVVRAENTRLQEEGPAEARLRSLRLVRDVETFRRSEGWTSLRAADKRSFIEARAELAKLANDPSSKPRALKLAVEGLDKFLDSLSIINRRETLSVHDREALAASALHLEKSEGALGVEPARARFELAAALAAAQRLYGRDRDLDGLLRSARRIDAMTLAPDSIPQVIEALRVKLAAMPSP